MLVACVLAALLGGMGWTLSEYLMHRFAGHGPLRRKEGLWFLTPMAVVILFHEEHTAHHRDPLYFAPTWKKALAAAVLVPVLGGLPAWLISVPVGLAFGGGFAFTYLAYEILHRRIHTHPPSNRYLAWMRRHHLHHHVTPKVNHGVTIPAWDVVFGTRETPAPVTLHHKLAPHWLLDESGAVRPEFATDYALAGRRA
ncbi:MAG: sterol desaturase family protein [Myxococcota bacterium]